MEWRIYRKVLAISPQWKIYIATGDFNGANSLWDKMCDPVQSACWENLRITLRRLDFSDGKTLFLASDIIGQQIFVWQHLAEYLLTSTRFRKPSTARSKN